jgi:hypothetical protein
LLFLGTTCVEWAGTTETGTPQESAVDAEVLAVVSAKEFPGVALMRRMVGIFGGGFGGLGDWFGCGVGVVVWGEGVGDRWLIGRDIRDKLLRILLSYQKGVRSLSILADRENVKRRS